MKSDMNSIPIFLAAAEAGSFSRAAENLYLTRSAVTKTIARLEARLGVTLFNRTTRSQSLTEQGMLYYDHCRRAVNEIQQAEDLLAGDSLQVSGRLRVSVPVLLGHLCIAPLLTALAQEHPGLQLDMAFSDRVIDLTEEGFDLAIRIGELADSGSLIARQLATHSMVFCAAPDYLARAGEPLSAKDLGQHAAIAYTRAGRLQKWRISGAQEEMSELTPQAKLMMDDMQAIKDAALSGCGIAWLPYWLVRDALTTGALRAILTAHHSGHWPVYAVWPRTVRLPLKVRIAVERLLSELPARMAAAEAPAN